MSKRKFLLLEVKEEDYKLIDSIPKEIINEEMEMPDEHYKEVGGPILYIPQISKLVLMDKYEKTRKWK